MKNEMGDCMKKTLKDRVLHGLKCVTRKCRILTRPAMFVMVLFLSVYHTIRAVLAGLSSRQARRLVCGGAVVSVLVLALIVWPSMADEIAEGDGIEIVDSFETATPEPTPIETVEPIATEELTPSESPTETLEPVETPAPEASGEEDPAAHTKRATPGSNCADGGRRSGAGRGGRSDRRG